MTILNLVDKRFGRLTILARAGNTKRGGPTWFFRCDCGKEGTTASNSLFRRKRPKAHCSDRCSLKPKTYREWDTPEYKAYRGMKYRCYNRNSDRWHLYGGRGIKVCDRWLGCYNNFLADMGRRPLKTSLDRINSNGDYEPGNCRWATIYEQNGNRIFRDRMRLAFGETLPLIVWAHRYNISVFTLYFRLRRGLSLEEALTKPLLNRRSVSKDSD
jgi:hypothetical protein